MLPNIPWEETGVGGISLSSERWVSAQKDFIYEIMNLENFPRYVKLSLREGSETVLGHAGTGLPSKCYLYHTQEWEIRKTLTYLFDDLGLSQCHNLAYLMAKSMP